MKKVLFTIGLSLFVTTASYAMHAVEMEIPTSDESMPILMNIDTIPHEVAAGHIQYEGNGQTLPSTVYGEEVRPDGYVGMEYVPSSKWQGHNFMKFGPNYKNFDGPIWLYGLAKLGHLIACLLMLGVVVFVVRKSWDLAGCKKKK